LKEIIVDGVWQTCYTPMRGRRADMPDRVCGGMGKRPGALAIRCQCGCWFDGDEIPLHVEGRTAEISIEIAERVEARAFRAQQNKARYVQSGAPVLAGPLGGRSARRKRRKKRRNR
jgi:hypothetical protein